MRYEYLDLKTNIKIVLEVRRQKNIILHFRPKLLYVTSPKRITKVDLFSYLEKYKEKILSLSEVEEEKGDFLCLFGKRYQLLISKALNDSYNISDSKITFYLKSLSDAKIKSAIKRMYYNEFVNILEPYLMEAKNHLRAYPIFKDKLEVLDNVKVNYYKTFLGRCFINRREIELSSYLAKYEPKYILGVIYHEMCHLLVPSHDKNFHKILDNIYPENRILTKEMKSMNRIIIKDFL